MTDRIGAPPANERVLEQSGLWSKAWFRWVSLVTQAVSGQRPTQLASYTVARLPDASAWPACTVYVSNESGGAVAAFSDGTHWRRTTDRAIVS